MKSKTIEKTASVEKQDLKVGEILRGKDQKGEFVEYIVRIPPVEFKTSAFMDMSQIIDFRLTSFIRDSYRFKEELKIEPIIASNISIRPIFELNEDVTLSLRGYFFANRDWLSNKVESAIMAIANKLSEKLFITSPELRN